MSEYVSITLFLLLNKTIFLLSVRSFFNAGTQQKNCKDDIANIGRMKLYYLVILFHLSCLLLLCSPLPEGVVEKDLYQVLGLKEEGDNSVKAIKKAYRKLAQIHHPDKVLLTRSLLDRLSLYQAY